VFANADAAETWFEENDPEGVAFEHEVIEPPAGTRGALLLRAFLDSPDVFVRQFEEPAGSCWIGDLTSQPSALFDLLNECRVQRMMV